MTTATVRIGIETGRAFVKAPYNKSFVSRAKSLNGKWVSSTSEWAFDGRDEQRVRDLCVELYGSDGATQSRLVTLKVELSNTTDGPELTIAGRTLVRRRGRDYGVQLGEGVIVLEGGFPSSGGSVKNPRVAPRENTILEVRDFPEALAEKVIAGEIPCYHGVEIISEPYLPNAKPTAADPLTIAVESGLARLNGEGGVTVDARAEALEKIRELMAQNGIAATDL